MPSGRSVPSAQTIVTSAVSDARWSNDAGAPSGRAPHSKNHASTSGGHASSTCRRTDRGSPTARTPSRAAGSITLSGGRLPYDSLTVARSGHTARRRRAVADMWFSLSAPGRPPTRPEGDRLAQQQPGARAQAGAGRRGRGAAAQRLARAARPPRARARRARRARRRRRDERAVLEVAGASLAPWPRRSTADRAVLVAQQPGERVEHPGAEAVGVEQQERRTVAAPVERADREAVVLDRHPLRVVRGLHHHAGDSAPASRTPLHRHHDWLIRSGVPASGHASAASPSRLVIPLWRPGLRPRLRCIAITTG